MEQFLAAVNLGIQHVLPGGSDHILFMICLFLRQGHVQTVFPDSLLFTAAHSISLILATIYNVSGISGTETAIAASIFFMAIAAYRGSRKSYKTIIFLFGLLHGMGFAAAIQQYMPAFNSITFLAGFNTGVEIAQLGIVLLCFLMLQMPFAAKEFYHSILKRIALICACIAIYWVIERIMNGFV
jgi:hypothetical protein